MFKPTDSFYLVSTDKERWTKETISAELLLSEGYTLSKSRQTSGNKAGLLRKDGIVVSYLFNSKVDAMNFVNGTYE